MSARIEAVLLDLGNVFAFHDNARLFRALGDVAGKTGEEVARFFDPETWRRINTGALQGAALREALRARLGIALPPAALHALLNCHFTLNTEIFPMVEALVGRVKLLLLSNTMADHFDFLLPKLPVLRRFDHLVLSYEVGAAKPEPAIFRRALELAGTAPEATAFFDDVQEYVDAARSLGIRALRFDRTADFPAQLRSLGL